MRLLLDTCTFLWMITADAKLSAAAEALLRAPDHQLYLSAVSGWEISVKYAIGKLSLPMHPAQYIPEKRELHGVLTLALRERDVMVLPSLPPLHKDPFDRMLVCQAIARQMVLVTPDPAIRAYPVRTAW